MTPRLAALALAVALTACADPATVAPRSGSSATTTPSPSADPDALVLQVRYENGLQPPWWVADPPLFSLYGDGRVVTPGAVPAIYPGPALPPLQVARVSAETVERLARAAREAGVDGQRRDYGDVPVHDAPVTVFRLRDGHGSAEARVYALSEDNGNAARAELRTFFESLTDLERRYGAGTAAEQRLYEPAAIAVFATAYRPHDRAAADAPAAQVLAWEGPDPAKGTTTEVGACTVLTGAALAEVLPDLRRSNELTRWTHEGRSWSFQLRPLLPDESTCADALA